MKKEGILRVLILFVGLAIAHLGVTLFLIADLGADPFNVMIQGLFRTLSELLSFSFITHGKVHMCICFLIILILLLVDRSYIKIGTIICMFCGGPIIDFYNWLLAPTLSNANSTLAKIILNVVGCIILAYGMTIVIKSEAGTGPNDLVGVVISEKLGIKFSIVRILVDVSFALLGLLLGGTIGLGTIICIAVVGPVAGFFMPFNEKIIKKLLLL